MTIEICQIDGNVVKMENVEVSLLTASGVLAVTSKTKDKKNRRRRNYILQNLIYYETVPDEKEISEAKQEEVESLKKRLDEMSKADESLKKTQALLNYSILFPADPLPNLYPTFCKENCYIPPCQRDWSK